MKHKTWFNWSLFFCFIMLLTGMIYISIGLVNLYGTEEGKSEFQKFINGELNTKFITIISVINVLGISVITTFLLSLSKQSHKLDRLDEAAIEYYEATERLKRKILKV